MKLFTIIFCIFLVVSISIKIDNTLVDCDNLCLYLMNGKVCGSVYAKVGSMGKLDCVCGSKEKKQILPQDEYCFSSLGCRIKSVYDGCKRKLVN